jgi:hypothetical protein
MSAEEATARSRSAAMLDTVTIIQAMASAEQQAGVKFESLPVEQQNAVLRSALNSAKSTGPLLTEQLTRREVRNEEAGESGHPDAVQMPDAPPVTIVGTRDLKTSFVRTGANVLDRTNAAVAGLVDAVGEDNASRAALGIQIAIGGIPRTALTYAGEYVLGGAKRDLSGRLSNLIADDGFDINSATPEQQEKIQKVSDALGRYGVDAAFSTGSTFVRNAMDSRAILNSVSKAKSTPEIGANLKNSKAHDVGNAAVKGTSSTVISPEMEEKILFGQRKVVNGKAKNDIIGAHSGEINNANSKYAVEMMEEYADGTRKVKILTQFPDGTLSKIKTSTLFPESWTRSETMEAVREVGELAAIAKRADGVSLYQGTVRGVRMEVIKDGANVTAAYPCGKMCSDPKVFEGIQ